VQGKLIAHYGKKQEKAKRNKMKNVSLQALVRMLREEQDADLPGDQEKLDAAEPKGKITAADFKKLIYIKKEKYQKKEGADLKVGDEVIPNIGPHKGIKHKIIAIKDNGSYNIQPILNRGQKNMYRLGAANAKPDQLSPYKEEMKEGADHEVAMAMSSLKEIVSNASQLMDKLGGMERNIPGWIQDHITNAENYIEQANQGFHEIQ
jgi:hypothetical protein